MLAVHCRLVLFSEYGYGQAADANQLVLFIINFYIPYMGSFPDM